MLLANNLSFKRGRKEIFQEMNISLPPKKIIHLKGRNGIGKTTLIKTLVNMLFPTTGEIYWSGKNIKKNLYEFYANLTYIMDVQTSKKELTVSENIRFWMRLFSSNIKSKQLEGIFDLLSSSGVLSSVSVLRGKIKGVSLFLSVSMIFLI